MSFEQHYARSCYEQDAKDRAALKRRTNRQLTREQRRRQTRKTMALIGAVCMLLAALLTILAALTVPVSADTETAKTSVTEADDAHPVALLEPEEPEEYENEKIEAALLQRATRIDNVTVTHYDCCVECCGKADGITASGVRATPGVTVAVDPSVIPLGSDVLVDYGDGKIQYYRADDVGGAVKGNHIDLCVGSHEEALALGVRTAMVWWVDHGAD